MLPASLSRQARAGLAKASVVRLTTCRLMPASFSNLRTETTVAVAAATLLSCFAITALGADNQHVGIKNAAKQASSQDAALVRISREPILDEQAATMRWTSDSKQVAWMQLLLPPVSARDKSAQQEIWTASAAPLDTQPRILLSSEKITAAIRESGPAIHRLPDDNGEQANPYQLQDFAWSHETQGQDPAKRSILLVGLRSLIWYELASSQAKTLVSGDQTLSEVAISPDGRSVTFLRDHKLWIVDSGGKAARVFNTPAQGDVLEGEPDWPYRNELHVARGYWWSPDSTQLAYLQLDDRKVDKYTLHSSDGSPREIVYPKPGGELPIAQVLIKRVGDGEPVKVQLGDTRNFYIPRVTWLPDGQHLAIERLDRRQRTLELLLADSKTGKVTPVITETDQYWINLADEPYFLADGKHFFWSSERSGFRHLYLYDINGKQLEQVTHGEWEVTHLDAVDETSHLVYLTATEKSPLERHVYETKFDIAPSSGRSAAVLKHLTSLPGTHTAVFAPDVASFADVYSSQTTRPRVAISPVSSEFASPATHVALGSDSDDRTDKPEPVEFLDLKLHQGLPVHALMIKPPGFDPAHKYPVIVYLAGGPGEQIVRNAWAGATGLWMQLMARNGYITFALDNQGTSGRGHYFEEPIHLRLGGMELADQRDGVQYLLGLPYVDSSRAGVSGWGYGGFLAVHAMLDKPLPYKAGFAGAPITNWHYYDAVFGERYLDDPVAYADGWDASTAIENAPNLKGALLLAQGTDDEFVHLENTLTLQDELLDAGKSADLLLLSDRGHQIADPPARKVLFTRMTEFFVKNL